MSVRVRRVRWRAIFSVVLTGSFVALAVPPALANTGSPVSLVGTLRVLSQRVGWTYADGHTLYVAPVDGSNEPVRVTPTSCTLSDSTHSALTGRCFDGTDGADQLPDREQRLTRDLGFAQQMIEAAWTFKNLSPLLRSQVARKMRCGR